MIIHLIRHTTPLVEAGVCYGRTDLELSDGFLNEKEQVLDKLYKHYPVVYSSPLIRCSKLAQHVPCDRLIYDDRLLEYNFGDWELKPWRDFSDAKGKVWMDDYINQTPPNGENLTRMQNRVTEFWLYLLTQPYNSVAVVTHSGVQRLIHAAILNTPLSHIFRLQLDYGAVLEVNSHHDTGLQTVKHL